MQAAAAAAAHSPNPNTNPPPLFYSATAGLYASTHPPLPLPSDPDLSLVPHLFSRLPLHHPHSLSLLDAATAASLSRADLRCLVSSLAAGLRTRLHIRRGSVVLLLLPNSLAFPVAFLAILAAGAVAATMNPAALKLRHLLASSQNSVPVLLLQAGRRAHSATT